MFRMLSLRCRKINPILSNGICISHKYDDVLLLYVLRTRAM
jgi:hypothetical protein